MPPLGTPGNQLPATNPAERVSADTRTSADTFSAASRSAGVASSTKQFAAKGAKARIASTTGVLALLLAGISPVAAAYANTAPANTAAAQTSVAGLGAHNATTGLAAYNSATVPAADHLILEAGHVDAFNVTASNGALKLNLKEDVTGSHVHRDPSKVELHVKDAAKRNIPAGWPGAGQSYFLPQTQDHNLLWPGWDTLGTQGGGVGKHVDLVFTSVQGPGKVYLFGTNGFGQMSPLLKNGATQLTAGAVREQTYPAHTHANWAFTKPGLYKITLKARGTQTSSGATIESPAQTYYFTVGSAHKGTAFTKPAPAPAPTPTPTPKPAPEKPKPAPKPTPAPKPAPQPTPTPAPEKPTPAPAPSESAKPTPAPAPEKPKPAPEKPKPAPKPEPSESASSEKPAPKPKPEQPKPEKTAPAKPAPEKPAPAPGTGEAPGDAAPQTPGDAAPQAPAPDAPAPGAQVPGAPADVPAPVAPAPAPVAPAAPATPECTPVEEPREATQAEIDAATSSEDSTAEDSEAEDSKTEDSTAEGSKGSKGSTADRSATTGGVTRGGTSLFSVAGLLPTSRVSGSVTIPANSHVHPNWVFSKPGSYTVQIRQSATLKSGGTASARATLRFNVGPGAAGVTGGHFDLGSQLKGSTLKASLKDDRKQPAAWVEPGSLSFALGDAARTSAPAGIDFVAPQGSNVWMVPSTQIPGVPWIGANTMHPSLKNTTGPVTWTLESVSGPGNVAVFTSGNFGQIVGQRWFHSTASTPTPGQKPSQPQGAKPGQPEQQGTGQGADKGQGAGGGAGQGEGSDAAGGTSDAGGSAPKVTVPGIAKDQASAKEGQLFKKDGKVMIMDTVGRTADGQPCALPDAGGASLARTGVDAVQLGAAGGLLTVIGAAAFMLYRRARRAE